MKVDGRPMRSIWPIDESTVEVIDQTRLPHEFATRSLGSLADAVQAIRTMVVRGAPLIGVTGAYGLALALRADSGDSMLERAYRALLDARPTAVNLRFALDRVRARAVALPPDQRAAAAWHEAGLLADEDVEINRAIGRHGAGLIDTLHRKHRRPVQVLTHCNAGWVATVDHGTALAAVYAAHDAGVPVHVWVDETRPRNQGALTAWELAQHGVPHTLIVDNAGGHLMQDGRVDMVLVGADRVSARGDVANKIGTYLKALAALDNGVPFYAAVPSPTIDWRSESLADTPIEERAGAEVLAVRGIDADGEMREVRVAGSSTAVANPGFDITPARLVTGLITERGIAAPEALATLFPMEARTR